MIKRKRPYETNKEIKNNDIIYTNKDHSFPSMHTAGTTVLGLLILYTYKSSCVLVFGVPFCIISRMVLGAHYFTDCVAGFLIPILLFLFMKISIL